jgi:hypothetical protein
VRAAKQLDLAWQPDVETKPVIRAGR